MLPKSIVSWIVLWTVLCGFVFVFSVAYLKSFTIPSLLIWMFGLPAVIMVPKFFQERQGQLGELEPFFQNLGFTKGPGRFGVPRFPGVIPMTVLNWDGTYRGRNFSVGLLRVRGLYLGPAPVRIETPSKTGKELYIEMDNQEKMKQNGLDDIYQRLEKIRLSRESTDPFEPTRLESTLGRSQLAYTLSGYLSTQQNIKELLDAICDMMDRLGI